jgi:CubicO group peptidase (beta-lactamase class C family)
MIGDQQLERMLQVRPKADASYQPAIAELLDLPARERPILVAPRQRSGRGVSRRTVTLFAIIALLVVLVGVFTAGSLRNVVVPVPSSSPTASPSVRADLPGAELVDLVGRWADARQPGALPFGAAVSIIKDERIWAATGGQFHRGIVRLGASGRLYLVAVALQLVDEGRLALDARIERYVNAWAGVRGVTVRQLMDGSSGVASLGTRSRTWRDPSRPIRREPGVSPMRWRRRRQATTLRTRNEARACRHTEDALLDEIIEAITGAPSSDAITTRILEPIALEKTFVAGAPIPPPNMPQLNPTGEAATEVQSGLWDPDGTGTLAIVPDLPAGVLAILGSARGMASSETDLARGTDALRSNPALLSESARAELARSIEDGGFGGSAMCPCDGAIRSGIGQIGHAGPYTTLLVYVPSERMTIAIGVNMAIPDGELEALLQQAYDLAVPAFR